MDAAKLGAAALWPPAGGCPEAPGGKPEACPAHGLSLIHIYVAKDACVGSFISVARLEEIVAAELNRMNAEYPVSYTHLDVYKRQDNILAAKEEGEMMAEAARSIRAAGVAIQDEMCIRDRALPGRNTASAHPC